MRNGEAACEKLERRDNSVRIGKVSFHFFPHHAPPLMACVPAPYPSYARFTPAGGRRRASRAAI
jgi:hypothetical protein